MASLLMGNLALLPFLIFSPPLLKQGNGDKLHGHDRLCVFPQLHTD